jgi:hypothetical protein
VSQIDHNQIDGAMAEVISRAQSEKRVRQLDMVARKRSEESKRIDNVRQQGNLATKRVIISGARNRATVHKQDLGSVPGVIPVSQAKPSLDSTVAHQDKPKFSHHRISDFKVPNKDPDKAISKPFEGVPTVNNVEPTTILAPPKQVSTEKPSLAPAQESKTEPKQAARLANVYSPAPVIEPLSSIEEIDNQPLDSSVGQLSDQYLVDQLTSPPQAESEDQPTIHDPEINETADLILDQDFLEELPQTPEAISETPDVPEPQMSAPPEPETPKQSHQVPAPKAKQENRPPEDTQNQPKEQPQPQPHTKPKPKKAGGAHRIYGQKLPEEYLVKSNSRKRSLNKRSPRPAKKRGFFFYLLILMIIIALGAWGIAGYLFFIY